MNKRFYVTTPIYYVNGAPHIGHAYTSIAADVMARFKRLDGYDVFFLTGTDEHGQKVEQAARAAGVDPQAFVDQVSADFRDMTAQMGVTNDDWIRTTEPRHKRSCAELWRRIAANGAHLPGPLRGLVRGPRRGLLPRERTDRPPGRQQAGADRRAGRLGARAVVFLRPVQRGRTSCWNCTKPSPDFIAPTARRNEVISFVRGGLHDLSISRTSFTWGIPVPDAPGHVMYVWLDALNNYVTACGFPDAAAERWAYWPADVHFVGKDIIRFHAVYWPAFLMAAGLPVPRRVTSNGWWVVEGEKMSKSLGNVIEPRQLVATYGLDQVRYFLLREKPFGADGSMSHQAIVSRINVELANDLGNLAQRSLSLVARNCAGVLPARGTGPGAGTAEDAAMDAAADALPGLVREHLERQGFHDALEEVWKVIRAANAYVDHQAPWALNRTDKARMGTVLRVLADTLRVVATVLQPFMPDSMSRMLDQLGVAADQRQLAALATRLPDGTALPAPQGVFPRYIETTT